MNLPEIISICQDAIESPSTDPNLRHALQEVIRRLNGRVPKNTLKPHRQSPEERGWAQEVKARADFRCQAPGCNIGIGVEAAHIFRRWNKAAALDPNNGICLCGWEHHRWFDEEASPEEAEQFARSIIGDETYDRLRGLSRQTLKRVPRRESA